MSQSLLRGTARYALARGLPGLVNFAALAIFTRLLNEREYGIFALTVASTSLIYACGFQWLSLAVLRLLHRPGQDRGTFLATVAQLFVMATALASVAFLVGVTRAGGGAPDLLVLAGLGLLVTASWHDLNLNLATADNTPGRYARLSGVRSLCSLGFGALGALAGKGAVGLVAGVAAGYGIAGLAALVTQWGPAVGARLDTAIRQELLRYGLPLAATYALDYVVSTSDRLLLGTMMSPEAAGLYSPAYDLCQQALWALMIIVNLAAYPLAIRAVDSGDVDRKDRQFRQHFLLLVSVAIPATVGLALLGPSLSGLLGPRFAPAAATLLPILSVAMFFGGLKSYYFDLSFQLGHSTKTQLYTVIAASIVNVLLNVWWIPRWGIRGAAWATFTAYAVALVVSASLSRRILRLPVPLRETARVALAAGGMAVVLLAVRSHTGGVWIALQVSLGAAVYFGLLWWMNPAGIPR